MRRLPTAMLSVLLGVMACGGAAPTPAIPSGPVVRSAKETATASKGAIVRVEAGDSQVGTGFVVDAGGLIATNLHVVAGLASIRVTFADGRVLPVLRIAAVDGDRDLVVLQVEPAAPLPTLTLGISADVAAGDPVIAIGNPLGVLDHTVSDGLISSVRLISENLTLLQISAPISQGSSGGPLFDQYGDVIGITQAIFNGGQNLNFAIPIDYLRALLAAAPVNLNPVEFARLSSPPPDNGQTPPIVRQVPILEIATIADCDAAGSAEALSLIERTIELGAPVYNQGDHEACFRIYEDSSRKLADGSSCAGVRAAFTAGLARAATKVDFTEKAWALRDTFDGIIDVFIRRAQAGAGVRP